MRPLAAALALPCLPSRRRHRWTRDLPDPFLFFFERHYCISEFQTLDPTTHFVSQVRGAAEGAGLGNAFLSNIQSVDGIFHVVRAFESEEVIHVDDTVDPIRDLETIQLELSKKDLTFVEAAEAKEAKDVKCTPGTKLSLTFTDTIKKCKDLLVVISFLSPPPSALNLKQAANIPVRDGEFSTPEVHQHLFLCSCPAAPSAFCST